MAEDMKEKEKGAEEFACHCTCQCDNCRACERAREAIDEFFRHNDLNTELSRGVYADFAHHVFPQAINVLRNFKTVGGCKKCLAYYDECLARRYSCTQADNDLAALRLNNNHPGMFHSRIFADAGSRLGVHQGYCEDCAGKAI